MLFVLRPEVSVKRLGRLLCCELSREIGNVWLTVAEEPEGARWSQTEAEGCILGAAGGADGEKDEIWTKLLACFSL